MSRIAKQPIPLPSSVEVSVTNNVLKAKGPKGELSFNVHPLVDLKQTTHDELGNIIEIAAKNTSKESKALSGTNRSIISNIIEGVSNGFQKKLNLVGVGYRAQLQGNKLNLTLGFSHPVVYELPAGITAEVPSQTEIVLNGIDKQQVGQVAAEIRSYRPPEPYKGKGVKYADELIRRKEAKKK